MRQALKPGSPKVRPGQCGGKSGSITWKVLSAAGAFVLVSELCRSPTLGSRQNSGWSIDKTLVSSLISGNSGGGIVEGFVSGIFHVPLKPSFGFQCVEKATCHAAPP